MAQTISDEEFHRMQLQLIEIRTENYQLKDENKKQAMKLKDLTEREVKLDKELNKQMKMKKAISTLNKSKQAQEYEALLQQTENEFALQNQVLMAELSKLSLNVEKLEKENQILKDGGGNTSDNSVDAELRRLQAENKVLKHNIESMQLKHKEELQQQLDSMKQAKPAPVASGQNGEVRDPLSASIDDPLGSSSINQEQSTTEQHNASASSKNSNAGSAVPVDERLLHTEALCERLKQQLNEFQDIQVRYETEKEEKILLQKALEDERSHHSREHRALANEVETFREKLDRKQVLFLQVQEEKEHLIKELQSKSEDLSSQQASATQKLNEEKEKLKNELSSLGNALQNAHNLLEKQQMSAESFRKQAQLQEGDKIKLVEECERLKHQLRDAEQKFHSYEQRDSSYSSQLRALEDRMSLLSVQLERAATERDDAVTKFEENARASGALLHRVDQVERANDALRREVEEAKELAEKRKKVMDQQAVDAQESNTKFNEQLTSLKAEYEATTKHSRNNYEEKIKMLEHTCKRQEQELIRMNHQDRAKTREVDSCQQQLRDMQSTVTSLENSKGWFERALKDAEKLAKEKEEEEGRRREEMRREQRREVEKIKLQISTKENEILAAKNEVEEAKQDALNRDNIIERLKQDIEDEVSKQRLVEKKGQTTLKDLKRQLVSERKRNEKLQEKLKEMSSSKSNLDELLQVVEGREGTGGDGSSVSSFSFRDLISTNKPNNSDSNSQAGSSITSPPVANVSKSETRDLLTRITSLQQEKWNLEEKVRHLEESAGAMADELIEKSKMLQQYVHHTRADHHRARTSNEELGTRSFGDRMKSIITGQEEADVVNIRELNRKLTRMLEEEMTKNMMLKQDLANLSEQLAGGKS